MSFSIVCYLIIQWQCLVLLKNTISFQHISQNELAALNGLGTWGPWLTCQLVTNGFPTKRTSDTEGCCCRLGSFWSNNSMACEMRHLKPHAQLAMWYLQGHTAERMTSAIKDCLQHNHSLPIPGSAQMLLVLYQESTEDLNLFLKWFYLKINISSIICVNHNSLHNHILSMSISVKNELP